MRKLTDKELAKECVDVLGGDYTKYFFTYTSVWAFEVIYIEFVESGTKDEFEDDERRIKMKAKRMLKKECKARGISDEQFRKQNWVAKKIYTSVNGGVKEDRTFDFSTQAFLRYIRKMQKDGKGILGEGNLKDGYLK